MFDPTILKLLADLGLGVAANGAYDAIKHYLTATPNPTKAGLEQAIQNSLSLTNTSVTASTVVDFLAKNGAITITGSHIYGPKGVAFASDNGRFSLGDGSTSRTDKTAITTPFGGGIVGTGQSAVVQNDDGSISFHVGQGGNIGFYVPKK